MPEAVSVRLETREIPTYVPGPDNPLPLLGILGRGELYPYASRSDISHGKRPVTHRLAVLENRYLRAEVLVDQGGRLYRLYDKLAQKDTFEYSPSMKYQNISWRGAWLSGGIEFNNGYHGHTVDTVVPVSWATRQNSDGSASIWVGRLTMPVESRWSLRMTLRPDRAALEMEIHVSGPLALPTQMYWWTNAAVEVTENSRFYYWGLSGNDIHSRHSWPICDGIDMRWYRNRYRGSDMFLQQVQRDEMAFYDFSRQHGVFNVADRYDAPGQKYFTWGTGPEGRYWDELLSDTPTTYAEIQRGRNSTQADSDWLAAMTEDVWAEQWAPLNNTGGFSATQNDLVLNVTREGDRNRLLLTALSPQGELACQALDAQGNSLGNWKIEKLAPGVQFVQTLTGAEAIEKVLVTDGAGTTRLAWQEFHFANEDWHKTGFEDPMEGPDTVDKLFRQAEKSRFTNWPRPNPAAAGLYERVLTLDPCHGGALTALAEVALYRGQNELAGRHIAKALNRDPLSGRMLMLLGWSLLRQGKSGEALEQFRFAARNEMYRRQGLFAAGCASVGMGGYELTLELAGRLLERNPIDKLGRLLKVIGLRKLGRTAEAAALVGQLLDQDPLWSKATGEALLLGVDSRLGGQRKLADDSVSVAMFYVELGLFEDAGAILQVDESNEVFSPAVRLVHQLYVFAKLGQAKAAARVLAQLRAAPVRWAHVWTTHSIALLGELAAMHPGEAMIQYLLANALASRERADEAVAAYRKAEELGMTDWVLLANLGALAARDGKADLAVEYYRKAWAASDQSLLLWVEADVCLAKLDRQDVREELYNQLSPELRARSTTAGRRATMLLDACRYEEAFGVQTTCTIFRGEFEGIGRVKYVESVVGSAVPLMEKGQWAQAQALLQEGLKHPRNLNMGRNGANPGEAMVKYFLGIVAEKLGRPEEAKRYWMEAATEPAFDGMNSQGYSLLAWQALGDRHNASGAMHRIESIARGEREVSYEVKFFQGPGGPGFLAGMVQLARGHFDLARNTWSEALKKEPHGRLLRLHLGLSDNMLHMLYKKV